MMLIRLNRWEQKQHLFTDDEKADLTAAVIEEQMPHWVRIDHLKLSPRLYAKLVFNLEEETQKAAG
jgi:hypothetical protein